MFAPALSRHHVRRRRTLHDILAPIPIVQKLGVLCGTWSLLLIPSVVMLTPCLLAVLPPPKDVSVFITHEVRSISTQLIEPVQAVVAKLVEPGWRVAYARRAAGAGADRASSLSLPRDRQHHGRQPAAMAQQRVQRRRGRNQQEPRRHGDAQRGLGGQGSNTRSKYPETLPVDAGFPAQHRGDARGVWDAVDLGLPARDQPALSAAAIRVAAGRSQGKGSRQRSVLDPDRPQPGELRPY